LELGVSCSASIASNGASLFGLWFFVIIQFSMFSSAPLVIVYTPIIAKEVFSGDDYIIM